MLSQGYFFPSEFLKICEQYQSGQRRHFGSTGEALIIKMFTMTGRPRERRSVHSKFHFSDLLMIAVYFGDAMPVSLTRHFDGRQAPSTRPKNSLMSLYVILSNM